MSEEKKYYITGYGSGSFLPLEKPGKIVHLQYAVPVRGVFEMPLFTDVEKVFEILRYDAPHSEVLYVARHNPKHVVWGRNQHAVQIPCSPFFERIFDTYAPQWMKQKAIYKEENKKVFLEGMQLAGISTEMLEQVRKQCEASGKWDTYFNEVVAPTLTKITRIPESPFIAVEGVEDILNSIEITSAPTRYNVRTFTF